MTVLIVARMMQPTAPLTQIYRVKGRIASRAPLICIKAANFQGGGLTEPT
jgi:hypothetical protein